MQPCYYSRNELLEELLDDLLSFTKGCEVAGQTVYNIRSLWLCARCIFSLMPTTKGLAIFAVRRSSLEKHCSIPARSSVLGLQSARPCCACRSCFASTEHYLLSIQLNSCNKTTKGLRNSWRTSTFGSLSPTLGTLSPRTYFVAL